MSKELVTVLGKALCIESERIHAEQSQYFQD